MAEEQQETEIDDTAEKAAEIGKQLGVTKDAPAEEIPDYDIEEVPDEKIAKEREPAPRLEKKERPRLSNKEKRDLRKKRVADKFNEKDIIIAEQGAKIQAFEKWQQEVNGRLSGVDKAAVDKAWNDSVAAFNAAERDHTEAFKEGDGDKATRAMRSMYEAQKNIDQIRLLQAQLAQGSKTEAKPQADNRPDPGIMSRKLAWEKKHAAWYKPEGRDVDSVFAKSVAQVLVDEGYQSNSDDFWDELDDRLAERIPDKINASDDEHDENEDDEDDEPEIKPVKKRAAPPIANGSSRGDTKGKKKVSLPTAFINTLKDNGIWDDKPKRDRIIANYLANQKASRPN